MADNTLYRTTDYGGSFGNGTVFKLELPVRLNYQRVGNQLVLSWDFPGWNLQSAPEVTGVYTNIPFAATPYTNNLTGPRQFFRLISN